MGMVGPRMGQPNVNQLQNQYLSQGQFPGVGPAQPGIAQPGPQTNMAQVRTDEEYPGRYFDAQNLILILFLFLFSDPDWHSSPSSSC